MAICAYCGKTFYKKHNRQVYCPDCKELAYQDKKSEAQRNYRKRLKVNGLKTNDLGSMGTSLGSHRNPNFGVEIILVRKQLKAFNLK